MGLIVILLMINLKNILLFENVHFREYEYDIIRINMERDRQQK